MNALQQIVERKRTIHRNNEFAVQNKARRFNRTQSFDNLREITRKRLGGLRLQFHAIAIAEGQTTEAVPLRFILPPLPCRHLLDRQRFHGWKRRLHPQLHIAIYHEPSGRQAGEPPAHPAIVGHAGTCRGRTIASNGTRAWVSPLSAWRCTNGRESFEALTLATSPPP